LSYTKNILLLPLLMLFSSLFASSSGVESFYQIQKLQKQKLSTEHKKSKFSKKVLFLKTGHSIIKNTCSRCHLAPFDTANMYTKKQWNNLFKYKMNKTKFTRDRNLFKNNKFYYVHSRAISRKRKETFINSLRNSSLRGFLLTYCIDSGNSRCLSK